MNHSYVMGIGEEIWTLADKGFKIADDGGNYTVAFPEENRSIWEDFISQHLEPGYWNEYLTENSVIFLFHLDEGLKRYEVRNFSNDEVLFLCEKLCECKFDSLKHMLTGNHYYRDIIG